MIITSLRNSFWYTIYAKSFSRHGINLPRYEIEHILYRLKLYDATVRTEHSAWDGQPTDVYVITVIGDKSDEPQVMRVIDFVVNHTKNQHSTAFLTIENVTTRRFASTHEDKK